MRAIHRAEKGQDILEYAIVLPLFILLILSVIEFGYLFLQYNTVTNAAREGARVGIISPTTACNLACVDARARAAANSFAAAAGLDPAHLTITATHPTAAAIRVAVSYTTGFMTIPLMAMIGSDEDFVLASTATMTRE